MKLTTDLNHILSFVLKPTLRWLCGGCLLYGLVLFPIGTAVEEILGYSDLFPDISMWMEHVFAILFVLIKSDWASLRSMPNKT